MPARYLLDTNIASYVIKGNVPRVLQRLQQVSVREVGVSVITEAELRFGGVRRHSAHLMLAIESFLRHVEIVPWDSAAAQHYAVMRASLEDSGAPMGNLDMLIAAQALASEAVLVTHDRVFQRVKHLKIEDWTKA